MDCAENIVSNNCEILDRIKTRIKYGLRILNGDEDGVRWVIAHAQKERRRTTKGMTKEDNVNEDEKKTKKSKTEDEEWVIAPNHLTK